jgi:hypothetical protein
VAAETPEPEVDDAAGDAAEAPEEAAPVEAARPPDIDLSTFEDQEKLPGTSDEDWTEIQGWAATYLDPSAGAAGNRAKAKLLDRGRESFPAILNVFKRLDFTQEQGYRDGDLAQKLLMEICKGNNFDWSYGKEPKNVTFNKKVVRFWIVSWEQARDAPSAWANLAKVSPEEAAEQFAITGPFLEESVAPAAPLDDF